MLRRRAGKLITVGLLLIPCFAAYSKEERYYCVQVISTKSYTHRLEKFFYLLKGFPNRRVEKIKNYYTLRVGLWKNRQEAEKFYHILKRRFPGALLRTCYKIPSRWVLPKGFSFHRSSVKTGKAIKQNSREEEGQVNYGKLARQCYLSYNPVSPEFKAFKFPQTRVKKGSRIHFQTGMSFNSLLFEDHTFLRESLSLENNRGKLGISLIKKKKTRYRLYVPELTVLNKPLDTTQLLTVKLGILKRKTYIENLSAPSISLSWSSFPSSGELSLGYAVRNGYNDLDLRNLLFISLYLNYRFTPRISTSTLLLTENLIGRKLSFYPFKERTWFSVEGRYGNLGSIALFTSSRGGYLADITLLPHIIKPQKVILGLSVDKNLPFPLTSKGKLHTEMGNDYLFNPDSLNLQRVFLKLSSKKSGVSLNLYRISSKESILGEKFYNFRKTGFLGFSFGGFYRLSFKNIDLNFYGGIFLPGTVFSDRSVKASGGFNLRGIW